MNFEEVKIYEPDLGLDGTIPELVDWANRYTSDYSDPALERISKLAKSFNAPDKMIQIPLLLRDERKREKESEDGVGTPYERMKIDHLLGFRVSYSASDGNGGETEVREEGDKILIALSGVDDTGCWSAAGVCSIDEFMSGDYHFLDRMIGEVLSYNKSYTED